MATEWKVTPAKELIAALRIGGWVLGQSGLLPSLLTLQKTDLIADLRELSPDHRCTWRIIGDPDETGRYAKNRRRVVIWLGK